MGGLVKHVEKYLKVLVVTFSGALLLKKHCKEKLCISNLSLKAVTAVRLFFSAGLSTSACKKS